MQSEIGRVVVDEVGGRGRLEVGGGGGGEKEEFGRNRRVGTGTGSGRLFVTGGVWTTGWVGG